MDLFPIAALGQQMAYAAPVLLEQSDVCAPRCWRPTASSPLSASQLHRRRKYARLIWAGFRYQHLQQEQQTQQQHVSTPTMLPPPGLFLGSTPASVGEWGGVSPNPETLSFRPGSGRHSQVDASASTLVATTESGGKEAVLEPSTSPITASAEVVTASTEVVVTASNEVVTASAKVVTASTEVATTASAEVVTACPGVAKVVTASAKVFTTSAVVVTAGAKVVTASCAEVVTAVEVGSAFRMKRYFIRKTARWMQPRFKVTCRCDFGPPDVCSKCQPINLLFDAINKHAPNWLPLSQAIDESGLITQSASPTIKSLINDNQVEFSEGYVRTVQRTCTSKSYR